MLYTCDNECYTQEQECYTLGQGEDYLKNEDDLKNYDDLENKDNFKNDVVFILRLSLFQTISYFVIFALRIIIWDLQVLKVQWLVGKNSLWKWYFDTYPSKIKF